MGPAVLNLIRAFINNLTNKTDPRRKQPALKVEAVKTATRPAPIAAPAVPKQSVDPRRFAGSSDVGAWVLIVADSTCACDFARQNAGRCYSAAGVTPVPAPDCTRSDCQCIYRAEPENRKGARRQAVDRREQIRFEVTKGDRRKNGGRRLEDIWERKRV